MHWLLTVVVTLAMLPGSAGAEQRRDEPAAPGKEAPSPAVELSQQWEGLLIRDALRYLRLTPEQQERLRPLADAAAHQLDRRDADDQTLTSLLAERVRQQRDVLAAGGSVALRDQTRVLDLARSGRRSREQAADAIARLTAPGLAGILSPAQVRRALLLQIGQVPAGEALRPALLDPGAGFAQSLRSRQERSEAAVREVLSQRYPGELLDLPETLILTAAGEADGLRLGGEAGLGSLPLLQDLFTLPGQAPPPPLPDAVRTYAPEILAALVRDREALRQRWDRPAEFPENVSAAEKAAALLPLARRLLTSRELVPAIAPHPGPVAAAEPAADRSPLEEHWEEVLLLEAIRFLRLAPEQLQQLRPLARAAAARLEQVRQQEQRIGAIQNRIARKQVAALAAGQPVSLQEQETALEGERVKRRKRQQAENEIAGWAAPKLARIFTPEQCRHSFRLAQGQYPPDAAPPLLLDPDAGFVVPIAERIGWREAAVRSTLLRGYPGELVDLPDGGARGTGLEGLLPAGILGLLESASPARNLDARSAGILRRYPALVVERLARDRTSLRERWSDPERLGRDASDGERANALFPLARRLLTSPRLPTVLAP